MAKFNIVIDSGVIRLPPGFRFLPTDEELVFQYLRRKVFSWPLPASIIPDINVCKFDPWELPGELEEERYFFSNKEAKYRNGNRSNRATASGYWKATGIDKQIVLAKKVNQIVGMKKTLVFYRGKPPHGSRTDWIMHEYRLVRAATSACIFPQSQNSTLQNCLNLMEKWVLCRIFLKQRNTKNDNEIIKTCSKDNKVMNVVMAAQPRLFDFVMADTVYSSSSSSCSSSITTAEVSSSGSDHEESSSCKKN